MVGDGCVGLTTASVPPHDALRNATTTRSDMRSCIGEPRVLAREEIDLGHVHILVTPGDVSPPCWYLLTGWRLRPVALSA